MDGSTQTPDPLVQIEQQVSVGMSPSEVSSNGPRILIEEPVGPPNKKNIFINIGLALGIVGLGTLCVVLIFSQKPAPHNQITQISPTPEEQAVVAMGAKYANPFEKSTQYGNPFSQEVNPFDAFDGKTK